MTKNLTFTSTDRTFHFVWLPESIGEVSVYSITFQTLWKENSLCTPLPFGNLPLSDPPTPRNFRDPPWGGYGYFLEPHIVICEIHLVVETMLKNIRTIAKKQLS